MPARRIPAAPFVGVALLSLFAVAPLHPQDPSDTVRLTPVVVTATRMPSERSRVAASVTTITGAELRERGIRFVLDWLREVPGLTVIQTGSFGGITSLFTRGGESDYTRLLIDGLPANHPGGGLDLAHLSTENVERIEVVRGPASVLYGSDAVSGVVQIITRRGLGVAAADVSARAGTYGTADLQAELSGGTPAVSWSAGASRFTSDGIYPINNRYRRQAASARVGVTPDPATDVAVAARLGDHLARFPTDFSGALADTNQFIDDRALALSLDGGRRLTDRLEVRTLGGWFDTRRDFDDRSDSPGDTLGFGFEQSRQVTVRRWLADVRVLAKPVDPLQVSVGIERSNERERTRSTTRSDFGTGRFTDEGEFERDRRNTATYGQVLAALGSRLDIQAGMRHDANEVFGGFTTWQAGAVARIGPALRLRGSVGTAFKQPTFSEQFADTPFEVGNADLVPERTRSWEAGVEASAWNGRVSASVTGFAQRFRDLIQYQAAAPGQPTYANVARARADGVEFGASAMLARGWSLSARYTRLDTEVQDDGGNGGTSFTEGAPLLRRPRHAWGLGLAWRREGGGSYGLQVQRTGSRADVDFREFPSPRVSLAGYTVVDASADLPLARLLGRGGWRDHVGLSFSGHNLLDAEYEPVVGFAAPGRTLLVGLRAAP